jgi:leader peptidase (prepilin peptidase)/N-methyltransferase
VIALDLPYWLALTFVFLLGLVAGSFLNVCIYRIPRHQRLGDALRGLWTPRSSCPRCRTLIRWQDNTPLVSWLLFVIVFWFEVPAGWFAPLSESSVFDVNGPQTVPGLPPWLTPTAFVLVRYAYHMVLIEALVVASFIDFDLRIIPDATTLPAMAIGVLAGFAIGRVHLVPAWNQNSAVVNSFVQLFVPGASVATWPNVPPWFTAHPHWHGLLVSVAGILVAGGVVWVVRLIGFWVLRREAMGDGDVVLMALIGAFLGWQPALVAFFIAPVCALVVVAARFFFFHRERYIPYGPYLSLGALVMILGFRHIWPRAAGVFQLGPLLPVLLAVMLVLFVANLMLLQAIKRLLGWELPPTEVAAVWSAADQNQYQAGERVDRHAGRWRGDDWPGAAASRGCLHEERWRRGTASGNHAAWGAPRSHGGPIR